MHVPHPLQYLPSFRRICPLFIFFPTPGLANILSALGRTTQLPTELLRSPLRMTISTRPSFDPRPVVTQRVHE